MPRIEITKQVTTRVGAALALAPVDASAAPNGMFYRQATGAERIVIKNADTVPHNMTVDIPVTVDGQAVADRAVPIPAGATHIAGPFGSEYRQPDGNVHLNFDSATSMTVGVLAT